MLLSASNPNTYTCHSEAVFEIHEHLVIGFCLWLRYTMWGFISVSVSLSGLYQSWVSIGLLTILTKPTQSSLH